MYFHYCFMLPPTWKLIDNKHYRFIFKVTNQMITACKSYITEHNTKSIWDEEQEQLIKKCKDCLKLNDEYQKCFQKTKKKIEQNPDEKQFEFSETYIFGKINTFARRLEKIIDIFTVLNSFQRLGLSKIEGIEMLFAKFQLITTTMKKKPYDMLDYRKMEFETDYEEFKRSISDLEVLSFCYFACISTVFFWKIL